MSEDRRELILARIFAVMQSIKTAANVQRNPADIPEFLRLGNYLALIDGDENRPPANIRVIGMMPGMVEMTPIIVGGLSTSQDLLGPSINALRAVLIKTLLSDAALCSIITGGGTRYGPANGSISYEALSGKWSRGSLMAADMQLHFSILYPFIPSEL